MNRIQEITDLLEAVLVDYPEIHTLILFGSALRNNLRPYSDIDVAVAGNRILAFEKVRKLVNSINSVLPYPVDLVDMNAISGPILKEILCEGKVLRKASVEAFAQLIKKMIYNQADMMPNSRMILKRHCHRFVYG